MKVEDIKNKFLRQPFYLKNGAGQLANRWKTTKEKIKEGKKLAREELGTTKQPKWSEKDTKQSWEESKDKAVFVFHSEEPIKNLEDALIKAGVDLTKWEIERHVCNTWTTTMRDRSNVGKAIQVPNHQYKVWFKPKSKEVESFVDQVKKELEDHKTPSFYITQKEFTGQDKNKCAIINLYDAHIDKMCYIGKGSLEKNIALFENAFDLLLNKAILEGASEIIFPVGNDFWNTNTGMNSTKKGTPQTNVAIADVDSFSIGTRVIRRCVEKAAQYCKVQVIMIPGNHDEDKVLYAGELLKQVYEGTDLITVDNELKNRKYVQWGKCLFGFAHGDKQKRKIDTLPLTMAEEAKKAWGETDYREFYLGDIHHKEEYKFLRGKDFVGCMVRFLRSVGMSQDKWHFEEGYVGVPKTAEVFVWHKTEGMVDNDMKNIK